MTAPSRLLVVALDNLGDAVMASSVLRPLKSALPQLRIGVFVKNYAAGALADHSMIDRLHSADPFWDAAPGQSSGGVGAFLSTVNEIRRERYDTALLLNTEWRRAAAAWAAGIPVRVGFARRWASKCLTVIPEQPAGAHFVTDHRRLVEALLPTFKLDDFVPRLEMTPDDSVWVEEWRQSAGWAGKNYVVFHPFSGDERKNWPIDRWRELSRLLLQKTGLRGAVICSKAEAETLGGWTDDGVGSVRLVGGAPLRQVKAIIARAKLLIGGDSGPGHMAAALGTPVLSLFGPGDPGRSGPVGRGAIDVIRNNPLSTLDVATVEVSALKILGASSGEGE